MDEVALQPYTTETALTGYLPLPREILNMNLPGTAILLYAVLLDRATLSQKNGYADESGWVYVVYPIDKLAETLSVSNTVIKRQLRLLEQKGLVQRYREKKNAPNHIFLNIPSDSSRMSGGNLPPCSGVTKVPVRGAKSYPSGGQKVPTNNIRNQHIKTTYYQHGEDESL